MNEQIYPTELATDGAESTKIKAFNPQIVVSVLDGQQYYNISYYDVAQQKWYIGYGSYSFETVHNWLTECFEKVDVDMVAVVRCEHCHMRIDREDATHGCYRHFMDECKLTDFSSYGENKARHHLIERIVDYECPSYTVFECSKCFNCCEPWSKYCPHCGVRLDGDTVYV